MFLETRSIERTVKAIAFFDRIIPRKVARVTDVSIVNRLFDVTRDIQAFSSPLDHLFANETKVDPEANLADLKKRVAAGESVQVGPADMKGKYKDIDRRPYPQEILAAYAAARDAGLWRFDERW